MASATPLSEQLAQCEKWCAERGESEYAGVASKGLSVQLEHHAELDFALPGQTPQQSGWRLCSDAIGVRSWVLLGLTIVAGGMLLFISAFRSVQKTQHPFLYALPLSIVPAILISVLPLRMLLRSHDVLFCDGTLRILRRIFGRIDREWILHVTGDVCVALAYRGARARRYANSGEKFPQLSIVVKSGTEEIAFGEDLDYDERARLAVLIDHHYHGKPRSNGLL